MTNDIHKKGVFIALEGLDGSGKDTQVDFLQKRPELKDAIFTREPGGTPVGMEIRSVVLKTRVPALTVETEMMLFFAARAEHLVQVIRPALQEGKIVISNRFALSTLAYEVEASERLDLMPLYQEMMTRIVGDTIPHYVLLDIPASTSPERMKNRAALTYFDARPVEFHERIRESMLHHVNDGVEGAVINGVQSPKKVAEDVWKAVSLWL